MQDELNEKDLYTRLNKNVMIKGRFYSIPKQNIREAVIFTLLTFGIINGIHFTNLVKTASGVILCPIIFIVCIKGIKHRSVLQILYSEYKFRKRRRILSLRGPEYVRKESKYASEETAEESVAETVGRIALTKFRDFIEKNSSNEAQFGE